MSEKLNRIKINTIGGIPVVPNSDHYKELGYGIRGGVMVGTVGDIEFAYAHLIDPVLQMKVDLEISEARNERLAAPRSGHLRLWFGGSNFESILQRFSDNVESSTNMIAAISGVKDNKIYLGLQATDHHLDGEEEFVARRATTMIKDISGTTQINGYGDELLEAVISVYPHLRSINVAKTLMQVQQLAQGNLETPGGVMNLLIPFVRTDGEN